MSNWMKTFMGEQVAAPYITTMQNLLGSILFTLVVAGFMLVIYRVCHDTLTYNKKFNITLMMLAVISTVLLALIQNNPLLSLGVLGSLSICRIRTNTKDPRDLGFVFWALAIGIASAVGAFTAGIASSLIMGVVLVVFHKLDKGCEHQMMVVRGEKSNWNWYRMCCIRQVLPYRVKMFLRIHLNWYMNYSLKRTKRRS